MIAGFALLAYYLYSFTSLNQLLDDFVTINPYYYVLAFLAVPMSVLCFSLAWNSLLSGLKMKVSKWKTYLFSWVGLFVDEVIPGAITGDFFKAYLISKDSGLETGKIVAAVVVQKFISIAIVTATLITGLTLLTLGYGLQTEFLVLSVISICLLVALFVALVYFSTRPKATERAVGWVARLISIIRRKNWDKARFQESAKKTLGPFHEGVHEMRSNPRALIKAAVFMAFASVFDITLILLVFSALHYPIPLDKALIVYALTTSLQATGVTVVGFTEVVMISLYTTLHIGAGLSITAQATLPAAVTLLTRFASLWFKLSIAFVGFQCVVTNRCVCSACEKMSTRQANIPLGTDPKESIQQKSLPDRA
jgi:hypothetical protein